MAIKQRHKTKALRNRQGDEKASVSCLSFYPAASPTSLSEAQDGHMPI
jgi:hypothetical protein